MKTGSGVETEVKILGGDAETLRQRLRGAGARLEQPRNLETNDVYDDEARSLTGAGKLLRLRNGRELTTKLPVEGPYKSRRETTVEVGEGPVEELLGSLGLRVIWRYEKWREGWDLDGLWVTLDDLPFVGTVLEVEGDAERIEPALAALGLREALRSHGSYHDLYDQFAAEHGLPPGDMTFAAEAAWRAARPLGRPSQG
ncbi:MAG TPA: class IV adenylate cyclase [Candidatus Dormibacteraeota bacterium]|nr:class IV adenylate cyclase [Candidatus Dormibacteraeota bacterium]